jgi:UDP-N-acetylmuramate--alanine ligase
MIPSNRIHKLHFIGIGGAGMSGIAEVLHQNGFVISGSDMSDSAVVQVLRSLGIRISIGHVASNVEGADLVVYSSAVRSDNAEMVEAGRRKIPVIRRAEMLGELMRLKYTLAIAGTHGKTTTTSMVGQIFEVAGKDPTVIVGGVVKGRGTGAKIGKGEYLVAESDEFDRSFLEMMPTSAIITNIDADHLDCYKDLNEIKDAFVQFANKVPFYGQVIACMDDEGVQDVLSRLKKPVVTYGFNRQADYRVSNLHFENGVPFFDVLAKGKSLGSFSLKVPGRHNILNATASIALALEENIELETVRSALAAFTGVKRRFEYIGEGSGVLVYDDYAHHPTEVRATLQGIREAYPERNVVVVFQPHLYSRTLDHYESFGTEFMNCDVLLVLDVYGSREKPIEGVTGAMVSNAADRRGHKNARHIPTKEVALDILTQELKKGDLVVLMGAGDIWKMGMPIVEMLKG